MLWRQIRWNGGEALFILNLHTRWRWVVSWMPRMLYSPTNWIRWWMCPRASCEGSGDEKISNSCHRSNPGYVLHSTVTIMTELLCTAVVWYNNNNDNNNITNNVITLRSFFVLKNLHLSQIVSGIRLCQGKEIHILSPKVNGHVLGICMLYDTFVIVPLFAPLLRYFWLNLYSVDTLGSFGDHSFCWDA
jgi:hypothetical protein